MSQQGIRAGLRRLIEALHRLDIEYMIVGSLASSIHGVSRATMGIDFVADLSEAKIEKLARELETEFHADAAAMKEAFHAGRAFNLIHYASSYKFDIFPLTTDGFSRVEFARRIRTALPPEPPEAALDLLVASEEDTLLNKLRWYRSGGETSERQWNDAVGIVRVRADQLDVQYLKQWAGHLRVEDLLDRLLRDAGA